MSQLSSMFAAGDIIQTILGTFFLGHPVGTWQGELKIFTGEDLDTAGESVQSVNFEIRRFMVVSRAVS